jgi:hypothetical protein
MKLYHGSPNQFDSIHSSQAQRGEGMEVPEQELLNGIYLTPDYGFALAVGAKPYGATHINDEMKEIEFGHPELFDPNKKVFIYEIDSKKIPQELLKQIDDNQFVVTGINELKPDSVKETTAKELLEFYKIKDFELTENEELKRSMR